MKKQIFTFAVSTIVGAGLALAAPQTQDQSTAPQTQDQQAAPENSQAGHGHRQMDPQRQVKMLTKRLNLTADQQNQIRSMLSESLRAVISQKLVPKADHKDRKSVV